VSGVCLEARFAHPNSNWGFVWSGPIGFPGVAMGSDYYWGGEDLTTYTGRFDFQSQVSDHHNLSVGVFFQQHDLRYDEWENIGRRDVRTIRQLFTASPWDGALYIQDRIEYDFLTLKLGARFDYGKATGIFFANPVDPTNSTNALDVCDDPMAWQDIRVTEWVPDPDDPGNGAMGTQREATLSADPSWTLEDCTGETRRQAARIASSDDFSESRARVQFSPRIGVSFPVTESASLFFNFGRYAQNPILINNYRNTGIGTPREGTIDGPTVVSSASALHTPPLLGNPHLLIETATTYEVGYSQEIDDTWALQAVVFLKDQSGLTGLARVGAADCFVRCPRQDVHAVFDPGVTYGSSTPTYTILTNQDFATTRGLELQLRRRLQDHWGMQVNYGYSSCRTNAASPEREFEAVNLESDPTIRDEIHCEIDQPHKFTGVWTVAFREDTPAGAGWLRHSNLSFVFKAASGLPYTPTLTFQGVGAAEQFERYSGRAPATWQLDMQLRKDFTWRNVRYGFFVDVWNLTDRKNCIQVFETSGSCVRGGEDGDRRQPSYPLGDWAPSTWFDRPQFMGQRRTITAGIRIVF
jgi:outer membrane receptor protein involved in Fe transport